MAGLYPETEPLAHGMLDTGDGDAVYWETCGSDDGMAAVVVHGGPGSGCTPWHRRLFDPRAYRIVLFDQRGAGRSRPAASDPATSMAANTTPNLIADMERLREHLGVDRWLVLGGSWGSTLALAYAAAHPDRVTGMVLFGVTTGRRSEADWLFREGLAPLFPAQWARRREAVPEEFRCDDIVESYRRMLESGDAAVREHAAFEWCMWESATPDWPPRNGLSSRFEDPAFRLGFARTVTHYIARDEFMDPDASAAGIHPPTHVPGILVNGRFDLQSPLVAAWELARRWPEAELVVVDGAGHAVSEPVADAIVAATDRFTNAP